MIGEKFRDLWQRLRIAGHPIDDSDRSTMDRIESRWGAERIKIRPGVSPEALASFELKYQVILPPALRSDFEAVDGTGEDMDRDWFRFRPFAEFVPFAEYRGWEPGEAPWVDHWFSFADHMINAPDFVIRLSHDPADVGPVAWTFGPELHDLTASFEEFLGVYLADRMNLLRRGL